MGKGFISDDRQYIREIKKQSLAAFKHFETVWDFNDFWKRGNTFDACLTFADAIQNRLPVGPQSQKSIQLNYGIVKGTLWFDFR